MKIKNNDWNIMSKSKSSGRLKTMDYSEDRKGPTIVNSQPKFINLECTLVNLENMLICKSKAVFII